jgi:hypothetical protein
MSVDDLKTWTDIASNAVTVVGLPGVVIALGSNILVMWKARETERKVQEERAFDELDDKYVEFMRLCVEHPDVDVLNPPLGDEYKPNEKQRRIEHALFAILISLFERARIMYNGLYESPRWKGWVACMESYCNRQSFRREWEAIGSQFDIEFQNFMRREVFKDPAGKNVL